MADKRAKTALGEELKRLRKSKNLTQEGLEQVSGVSQSYIAHIENGIRDNIGSDKLNRLCEALDVPLDHFAKIISPDVTVPPPPGLPLASVLTPVDMRFRMAPVVGWVGAGPATDYAPSDEVIPIPVHADGDMVVYRVRGDSMLSDGIEDGAYLIVRRDPEPRPGEQVIAWLQSEGGCVVKTLSGRAKQSLVGDGDYKHALAEGDVIYGAVVGRVEWHFGVPGKKGRK